MIDKVINTLDKWSQSSYTGGDYYGIFFRGKQLVFTKARIYRQQGRAKAEIIGALHSTVEQEVNKGLSWNDPNRVPLKDTRRKTKQIVDQLITDGILEIKKV